METKPKRSKFSKFIGSLGPGLVTGAADDDPSGIFTYSQTGAQFGLGQLWTAFLMLPLLISIQEICGRIGIVTGKGITQILKENYSKILVYSLVGMLVVANTINLGADLGAMASVTRLFLPGPFIFFALFFFVIILSLEILVPYHKYATFLKWLTLSLFAYFLTGLLVVHDWKRILYATFIPHIEFNFQFFLIIVGVLGTTISPYMFFWQASQEVEEKNNSFLSTHRMPKVSKSKIAGMRIDTFSGMIFSEVATWFIIVTTAIVLHDRGITDITSAAQAAQAFQPLVQSLPHSGLIAEALFSIGIIGTGLLAIPIFAACSSYAVAELFNWKEGLENKFNQAKGFYGVIIVGTFLGLLMNLLNINPIKALVYTAVLNGIVAVPIIFMLIKIGSNQKIMGKYTSGTLSKVISSFTFLGMASAALFTLYSFLK